LHTPRLTRIALAGGLASALLPAGCGGAAVDRGGFTAKERELAQARLDTLRQTAIPGALLQITTVTRKLPDVCRIHFAPASPKTFKLFLFWAPTDPLNKSATYTWFEATLRDQAVYHTFHIGYAAQRLAKARVLKAHADDVFAKPTKRCQILGNGYLRLLPDT
jgi:hypothetical protein